MRTDHDIISRWIPEQAQVLDLGCGDGSLLEKLALEKNCRGLGIEINPEKFNACLAKGLNVIEQNLDEGLPNFSDERFDIVVLSQTLQALTHPDLVLEETLRVGKQSIVAFPNFGNFTARFHLVSKGRMPVSKFMPYNWYDTPNIHFCTINDFEQLCKEKNIQIINKAVTNHNPSLRGLAQAWPNLFASTAIYHLSRKA
jgi:methionine biosynthesis protein MetW